MATGKKYSTGPGYVVVELSGMTPGVDIYRIWVKNMSTGIVVYDTYTNGSPDAEHNGVICYKRATSSTEYVKCVIDDGGGDYYAVNFGFNGVLQGISDSFWVDKKASGERPDDWYWYSTIASGNEIKLSAVEWNDFCSRINEFRVYKELPEYGLFQTVSSGDPISASTVNHAVYAIGNMDGTAMNYEVLSGDPISASVFIGLQAVLNSL